MKTKNFKVTGISPMMMHSIRLADPLDEYAKSLKKVSSKRKKTDDDHLLMAKIEFLGAMYFNKRLGIYIPSDVWEAALVDAAKKFKLGKVLKTAVIVGDDTPLKFDGPTSPEERWEDVNCVDRRAVRVAQARIMRTRPIFDNWSARVEVHFMEDLIDSETVEDVFSTAGEQIGIGDYRPKYGRFQAMVI